MVRFWFLAINYRKSLDWTRNFFLYFLKQKLLQTKPLNKDNIVANRLTTKQYPSSNARNINKPKTQNHDVH